MARTNPDHTNPKNLTPPATENTEPSALDPVAASEPEPMPHKKSNWLVRLFTGSGKASGGPAGPTQQTGPGGTPLR